MSNSLRAHGLWDARLPCPSLSPQACSNSCLLSRWCHPTISSSVVPFSSCLQSFPASGSFPLNQLFAPGGQSIGALASASDFPVNIQGWFPLGWTGLVSMWYKGLWRVFALIGIGRDRKSLSLLLSLSLLFPSFPLWAHCKERPCEHTVRKQLRARNVSSPDTETAGTLTLDFTASRMAENNVSCSDYPIYGILI